jgi:uncharacterized membrane protein
VIDVKIINFLNFNNWNIKKIIILVISIQFALLGSIGLELLGIETYILRPFFGIIYLLFIPGFLFLRLSKVHKLSNTGNILFAIGLSITFLMFVGMMINHIFPLFNISPPLTLFSLIITISVLISLLCIICYITDEGFEDITYIKTTQFSDKTSLCLFMLPFLAIFGSYLMNNYSQNVILLITIILMAIFIIYISFEKSTNVELYPLYIFVFAITLLLHNSLISNYIWGWDIHEELYLSELVLKNSSWEPNISRNINAMQSIVMLSPIVSKILAIDIVWVFKVIYPLIYSFVPVGLYQIFKEKTNEEAAFLATLFFISYIVFHQEMLQLARQQIAEIYTILLLGIIFNTYYIEKSRKPLYFILFIFSLIISHYGISYLLVPVLILGLIFHRTTNYYCRCDSNNYLNYSSILIYIVILVTWYTHISDGSLFNNIIHISQDIINNITNMLKDNTPQGMDIIIRSEPTFLRAIYKYLHIIMQTFISIGVATALYNKFKRKSTMFGDGYLEFSVVFYIMLIAGIIIPHFANQINTSRLYHIALIMVAPFCIIGMIATANGFVLSRKKLKFDYLSISYKVAAILIAIFLLFNTGFIFEVTNQNYNSFALSEDVDYPLYNQKELKGAYWLHYFKNEDEIYADLYRLLLFGGIEGRNKNHKPLKSNSILRDSYLYLGTKNIIDKQVLIKNQHKDQYEYINVSIFSSKKNKLYTNYESQIYK